MKLPASQSPSSKQSLVGHSGKLSQHTTCRYINHPISSTFLSIPILFTTTLTTHLPLCATTLTTHIPQHSNHHLNSPKPFSLATSSDIRSYLPPQPKTPIRISKHTIMVSTSFICALAFGFVVSVSGNDGSDGSTHTVMYFKRSGNQIHVVPRNMMG